MNQLSDPKKIDHLEETIRNIIQHEDHLVNLRIGWLLQTQGLLFGALAFAWGIPRISYIVAAVGIAITLSIRLSIMMYSPAVRGLRDLWKDGVPEIEREYRRVDGNFPQSEGLRKRLMPWRALPIIFITAWILVILVKIFDPN